MNISWKKLEHLWRKQLLSFAQGNILELGVGEGNNFRYYPAGVNVTATDMSTRIIETAKKAATRHGVHSSFIVSSAGQLQLTEQSFDTIVSTFFLSALDNPVKALQQCGKWCKPDGKILILDYGLSRVGIVSWLQRKWEKYYYRKTGCYLSRDLVQILSQSNLCLKRVEVKYAGAVYLIWASLYPQAA